MLNTFLSRARTYGLGFCTVKVRHPYNKQSLLGEVDLTLMSFTHCLSSSSASSTHLLPGARDHGGGPVVPCGRLLSSRGPPVPSSLLGHRPAGPVPEPHQRGRFRVNLLLPAPPAQHEREKAGLPGVASWPGRATKDLKPPGCSV